MTAILIFVFLVIVAAAWALAPLALFGVRVRLERVVAAQRRHSEELAAELRRLNAILHEEGPRLLADAPRSDRTLLVRNGGVGRI